MKRSYETMVFGHAQKARLLVSQDGYLRMPVSELSSLTLTHFLSGLDNEATENNTQDVNQTTISGYTEWISKSEPAITVGWDWHLDLTKNEPCYVRHGWPRTNLMLVDTITHQDIGDEETTASLARLIDQSEWTSEVFKYIGLRYI